uniref:Putative secreted protein n=1 Tax=Anopheles triannulatus TaxID=58253 RepID=A0A2M4B1Q8_9DIPT
MSMFFLYPFRLCYRMLDFLISMSLASSRIRANVYVNGAKIGRTLDTICHNGTENYIIDYASLNATIRDTKRRRGTIVALEVGSNCRRSTEHYKNKTGTAKKGRNMDKNNKWYNTGIEAVGRVGKGETGRIGETG